MRLHSPTVLDDIGYNDVGFNGGIIPTPFIDSLSSQVRLVFLS